MSNQAHFDISAAVVRQLGDELVSDEVTALVELVKNAYDADATFASVIVDTHHITGAQESSFPGTQGIIMIEDDGMGMDRNDIDRGWLTISLSHKRGMKREGRRTPKGRTPLGDKGLGRLSTQRLGSKLDVITRKDGSSIVYHVSFEWNDFQEETPLTLVPVRVETLSPSSRDKGTRLLISALRDPRAWAGDARDELLRRLSQLIFPFGEARAFRVYVSIDGQRYNLETIAESVREAAVARFRIEYTDGQLHVTGRIRLSRFRGIGGEDAEVYQRTLADDNGSEFFAYLTSSSNRYAIPTLRYEGENGWFISFSETRELKSLGGVAYVQGDGPENAALRGVPADPGSFHAELDEFLLRGADLESVESVFDRSAEFSQYIKNHAGVRIFRDGFGIRPYGVDDRDWLNLGSGQTSGPSFYGLRPGNVIGYVALSESENRKLREKTDREGFISSPYSANFFLLMQEATKIVNGHYHRLRRSFNEYREVRAKEASGFTNVEAPMAEMRRTSAAAERLQEQSVRLDQRLGEVSQSVRDVTERVRREPLFATAEETAISPVLGEVHTALEDAQALVRELKELLPRARRLGEIANYLEPKITTLETQLEDFAELAGLGLTAEALSHEIHTVADRLAARTRAVVERVRKQLLTPAELTGYTESVLSAVNALRKQLSHLAPSLRYVREKQEMIGVREFFLEMQDFYSDRFRESGISFILSENLVDFTLRMNRGRLTQIVDNLVLNSEYWLTEAFQAGNVVHPQITVSAKAPYIQIFDNGPGVDPTVERTLFQPFVSTKPKNQGRGLGLFIVQQLLDSMGGRLTLLPERNAHGRRYIFQLDLSGVTHRG